MTRRIDLSLSRVVLLATCTLVVFVSGCKKKEDAGNCSVFNRSAYLENLATHSIIPAYEAYKWKVDSLKLACESFAADPTLNKLHSCQSKLHSATLAWQYAAMFDFGAADLIALQASTNTYPTDTALIQSKIESNDLDIESVASLAARGLPALDYLLHGPISFSDDEVLVLFDSDVQAQSRRGFLTTLTQALSDQIDIVLTSWDTNGEDYSSEFISSTGTAVGSSMGLFLNGFNMSYESHTRTEKVGIPVGALTFSQTPLPDRVEAFYGQNHSEEYLMASVLAFEKLFIGSGIDDEDYSALDDYLASLDAQYNGDQLASEIKTRINAIKMSIESITTPFSEYVESNQSDAIALYADMQQLNVLWKVDMMSALGILITYQDNDGD